MTYTVSYFTGLRPNDYNINVTIHKLLSSRVHALLRFVSFYFRARSLEGVVQYGVCRIVFVFTCIYFYIIVKKNPENRFYIKS